LHKGDFVLDFVVFLLECVLILFRWIGDEKNDFISGKIFFILQILLGFGYFVF
jgi:hypothetical protein